MGYSIQLEHDGKEFRNGYITVRTVDGAQLEHDDSIQNVFRNREERVLQFTQSILLSLEATDELRS